MPANLAHALAKIDHQSGIFQIRKWHFLEFCARFGQQVLRHIVARGRPSGLWHLPMVPWAKRTKAALEMVQRAVAVAFRVLSWAFLRPVSRSWPASQRRPGSPPSQRPARGCARGPPEEAHQRLARRRGPPAWQIPTRGPPEVCQRPARDLLARGSPGARQRLRHRPGTVRGLPELPEVCQRIARGLPEAGQRLARGLPEAGQRLARDLPAAARGPPEASATGRARGLARGPP